MKQKFYKFMGHVIECGIIVCVVFLGALLQEEALTNYACFILVVISVALAKVAISKNRKTLIDCKMSNEPEEQTETEEKT